MLTAFGKPLSRFIGTNKAVGWEIIYIYIIVNCKTH